MCMGRVGDACKHACTCAEKPFRSSLLHNIIIFKCQTQSRSVFVNMCGVATYVELHACSPFGLLSPYLQFRLLLQSSVSRLPSTFTSLPSPLPSPGNHHHAVNKMETSQTTPLPTGWKEGQSMKLLWMQQIVCMWLNHSLHTQTTPSKWLPQHQLDGESLDQK